METMHIESSCSDFENQIDSYLDSELTSLEKRRFEIHVGRCNRCATALRDVRRVVDMARSLQETSIPTPVRIRLRDAINKAVGHPNFLRNKVI